GSHFMGIRAFTCARGDAVGPLLTDCPAWMGRKESTNLELVRVDLGWSRSRLYPLGSGPPLPPCTSGLGDGMDAQVSFAARPLCVHAQSYVSGRTGALVRLGSLLWQSRRLDSY